MKKTSLSLILILMLLFCASGTFAEEKDDYVKTVAYKKGANTIAMTYASVISPEMDYSHLSYPMLAASESWYQGNTPRNTITEIVIKNSAVSGEIASATESWYAAVDKDGDSALDEDIICYVNGSVLTIAGNGSGKIHMNPDSKFAFSTLGNDEFSNVEEIHNTDLLDTSRVTEMKGLLWGCTALESLDVSSWDTSNVIEMYSVFNGCSSLKELDLSKWNTSKVTEMRAMFNTCSSLKELDLSAWDTSALKSTFGMFNKCAELEKINLTDWDTSGVTTMSSMFQLCSKLSTIVGVESFDTSAVTDLSFMFYDCPNLKTLDLRNYDTSKVENFDHIFCHSAITLAGGKDAVKNWDTSSATNMNAMFYQIQNPVLDVSHFDTSNVTVFSQMFEGCAMEEIIGLENFDTSNGITFHEMFWNAYNIKELDLSTFDTRKAKNGVKISANNTYSYTMKGFFGGESAGNPSLERVILGENFSFNGDGTNTNADYMFKMPKESSASGSDTYWETPNGKVYAPADVPDKTAGVYTARSYSEPILVIENAVLSAQDSSVLVNVSINEEMKLKNGKILIAVYDGNSMVGFTYKDAEGSVGHTFEELPLCDSYTIKAFYLSDFGKLTPLCNSVIKPL